MRLVVSRRARLFATVGVAASVVAGALARSGPAWASAFQLKSDSTVDLGRAYSGNGSAAETPDTVFNNPAGMTQLPGLQISLGGDLIDPSYHFSGSATNAFGQPVAGAADRDGAHSALVPHGAVTYQIGAVSVGLALTSPFGLQTYYGPDFVGRYQSDKAALRDLDINPAIAWRVTPWLSLGAGVSANHATAQFGNAVDSSGVASALSHMLVVLPDGLVRVRGDDWAFGYNFGALITPPGTGTKIGLTYRSRIQQDFSGTVTYDVPAPLSLNPAFRDGPANAKLVLPDTAGIGITQRLSARWTGYAALDWTNWSQFKDLSAFRASGALIATTPERYRDTVFVSAGASYEVDQKLTLRGGVAFDEGAVRDAYRTAAVPDSDRYWVAAGASYRVNRNLALDVGYAHLFVADASIQQTAYRLPDTLTGHYSNHVDVFSFGARVGFQ